MKTYIAMENKRIKKQVYWFNIYRIKNNNLIYIWEWQMHYWLTPWPLTEVMKKLIELKEIPEQKESYYEHIDLKDRNFTITFYWIDFAWFNL